MEKILQLKGGRDKAVRQMHPWIFSGAVESVQGDPQIGETVRVVSASGEGLGWAGYSPHSQIRARMWTWDPDQAVNEAFIHERIRRAVEMRRFWVPAQVSDAVRLVHAESDGLPGLVVDRYADWLVVQFLTAGAEYWRETILDALRSLTGLSQIYERSDVEARRLEGLPGRTGLLSGSGEPGPVRIQEHGLQFDVGVKSGQKTGFYLDQRDNRRLVGEITAGCQVLNCFSYTGGFTLYALRGGAESVLSVDSSAEALEQGAAHVRLNGLDPNRAEWLAGDVFQVLRKFRDQGRSFNRIILDPPKFAQTAAQAQRAARGYKDINLLAFKLLRPGGMLVTFSCSGGVTAELFQKIVAGAALDAGVEARIVRTLTQAPDHPVAMHFPEGAYLKGLVCQV